MSYNDSNNRRDHSRIKLSVPVEIRTDASASPIRGATADLSLTGCYIETIYPFPVGTHLDLQLSIETVILVAATVVTCDPQVGNGIRFSRMLDEDKKVLAAFLEAAQQEQNHAQEQAQGQGPEQAQDQTHDQAQNKAQKKDQKTSSEEVSNGPVTLA
jgi:c-di-GMP-binding flagellar brake protein YcgR